MPFNHGQQANDVDENATSAVQLLRAFAALPVSPDAAAVIADAFPFAPLLEESHLYTATASPLLYIQGVRNDWLTCTLNLLCQFLQQQRRVLVTSSNTALLQLVTAQLAPAFKGAASLPQLDDDLKSLQRAREHTTAALVSQIQTESQRVDLPGISGTPLSIGQFVEQKQARDGWLGDALRDGETLPLDAKELEILRIWWASSDEVARRGQETKGALEQLRQLPSTALVREHFADWKKQRQSVQAQARKNGQDTIAALSAAQSNANQVAAIVLPIRQAAKAISKLPKPEGWIGRAISETSEGKPDWIGRKGKLDRAITLIQPIVTEIANRPLEIKVTKDHKHLREQLREMINYLEKGGSLAWWRPLTNWKVAGWRTVSQQVRLDEQPCYGLVELKLVLQYLETKEYLATLWPDWKGIVDPKAGSLQAQLAELQSLQKTLGLVISALEPRAAATDLVRGLNVPNLALPTALHPRALEAFAAELDAFVAKARQRAVSHPFEELQQSVAKIAARFPESRSLQQAFTALQQGAVAQYEQVLKQVASQEKLERFRQRGEEFGNRLNAKMPAFAHQLQATASDEIWKTRLPGIQAACVWSQAYRWLRDFCARRKTSVLHQRYAEIEAAISQVVMQRAVATAAARAELGEEPVGCTPLIPGCCWLGEPASALVNSKAGDQPPYDIVLLLTDCNATAEEVRLLSQTKQLIILERTDVRTKDSLPQDALGSWRELLSAVGVAQHELPALDPRALPTTTLLVQRDEEFTDHGLFRSDVARLLSERGFALRQTLSDDGQRWNPTLVVVDPNSPFVVQCYDATTHSAESIRRDLAEQMRWRQAGWQIGHFYASDYYVQGELAIERQTSKPSHDSKSARQNGAAKRPNQRTAAGKSAAESSTPANGRWRRLLQLGAQLQFSEQGQLIAADLRHTFATHRDLAELSGCPELRTVHFPFHATDEMLKQLTWLSQLTGVNLSYSRITNRGLAILQSLAQLRWLGLCGTCVSDAALLELLPLASLVVVDLRMTRVTERALREFQVLRPDCKTQFSAVSKPIRKSRPQAATT